MGGYGHNLSNLLKNSRRKERKAYDQFLKRSYKKSEINLRNNANHFLEGG